mmetsp:Transcript_24776/g.38304  ORF Transcript_24776/g.38304 Transcript_24776/m.38304 type:complete len:88 (-) Transcript_24776:74-337(-)
MIRCVRAASLMFWTLKFMGLQVTSFSWKIDVDLVLIIYNGDFGGGLDWLLCGRRWHGHWLLGTVYWLYLCFYNLWRRMQLAALTIKV